MDSTETFHSHRMNLMPARLPFRKQSSELLLSEFSDNIQHQSSGGLLIENAFRRTHDQRNLMNHIT
jgi:hypothetical protein